jgi:hypothetical protein
MKKIVLNFTLEILIPEGITINQDNLVSNLSQTVNKTVQRKKRKAESMRFQLEKMKNGETISFLASDYSMKSISAICCKTAKDWGNRFYFKTKSFKDGKGNIWKTEVTKF